MDQEATVNPIIRQCNKIESNPFQLPPWEELSPEEQIPIANLSLDHSYLVTGGPGTGKTLLAIYRTGMLATRSRGNQQQRPIKLVIFNRTLQGFLQRALKSKKLDGDIVTTWHSFIYTLYRKITGENSVPEVTSYLPDFNKVKPAILEGAGESFGHILVDEAQDLPIEVLEIMNGISSSMTIFMDVNQAIRGNDTKGIHTIINRLNLHGRRFHLSRNYRNTKAICKVARLFYTGPKEDVGAICQDDIEINGKKTKPLAIKCSSFETTIDQILAFWQTKPEARIGVFVKSTDKVTKITKALRDRSERIGFDGKTCIQDYFSGKFVPDFSHTGIIVTTYQSSKGLEFDAVYLPFLSDPEFNNLDGLTRNQLYVGCTRARQHLALLYSGDNPVSPIPSLMLQNRDLFRWSEISSVARSENFRDEVPF